MDTNTVLGFAAALVFLLLWSYYSKRRGFIEGFFAALLSVAILAGLVLVFEQVVLS